ncbi:MAG: protein kinase [Acidobacteriota bacterium]
MELARWQQIDNILVAALELDPAERASFIEQACSGDESLRQEVISLFSYDEQALDIDTPALESAACILAPAQPDLAEGQYVGHYRIDSLLGAGGMGEVYLAEDMKLGRRIALKLLPADFTEDRDWVRRFQQEARAASALNHPNIITIHETGEFEDRHFIATEFIEGETLRHRIRRTALNLGEALDIAIQVANALVAAHQAGIVHRDIKPENIMLRPDGYVKVLDFGLAKLSEQSSNAGDDSAHCETDTMPGLLMGTVKYMSPEQARGLSLDGRSDIFSLGVVVYEMLAGRPPFEGETSSDVIAALLKEDPAPLSQFVPELPVELERIISKALAKNRDERYQTINDFLVAVRELRNEMEVEHRQKGIKRVETSGGIQTAASGVGTSAQAATTRGLSIAQRAVNLVKQNKLSASLALLIAIVIAGWVIYRLNNRGGQSRGVFQEVRISQLVGTDKSQFAAVSPDGKYVAYTVLDGNKQSLALRLPATNSNTVLVPPSDAWYYGVTFSRDGNYLYYVVWGKGDSTPTLYQIPASGGDSQKVLENIASPVTFSPDGNRFAFVREITKEETGLFIADADGSEERLLARRKSPSFLSTSGPSWSPDGKLIACAVLDKLPDEKQIMNVIGVSVEDGAENLLTKGKWSRVHQVAWLSDNSGFIMVATEKGEGALLWRISYPEGDSRRLTSDPSNYFGNYNSISLTADSKLLVASRFEQRTNLWSAPGGDTSQIKQITFGGNHRYLRLAWTPDGRIVFPSDASGDREIWIMEADGSGQKQLTADGRFNALPTVSPDGRYIVYTSGASSRHIWRMDIDGSNPVQLTNGEEEFGPQYSPDGQWVFYMSVVSGKATIWKIPIDGGEPVQFTKEPSAGPAVSPDGSLVACWWSGKIAIIPFDGGEPIKFIDPLPGPHMPMKWTSDGRALIYDVTRNDVSNIWSQPLDGGPPKQLTDFKSETILGFDWSRDDNLVVSRGFTAREIVLIQDLNR